MPCEATGHVGHTGARPRSAALACRQRATAEWLCGQVEAELARIGGADLSAEARGQAHQLAALCMPWDGRGPEPLRRIVARLDWLTVRLDLALGE